MRRTHRTSWIRVLGVVALGACVLVPAGDALAEYAIYWFEVTGNPTSPPACHRDPRISYVENAGNWAQTGVIGQTPVDEVNFPGVVRTPGLNYSRFATVNTAQATFTFTPAHTAEYEVFVTWGRTTNGDRDVTYTLNYEGGSHEQHWDQHQDAGLHSQWNQVGGAGAKFLMNGGTTYTLVATNPVINGAGRLMCDAVVFRVEGLCASVPNPTIKPPLVVGDTTVVAQGVLATATAVNVYADGNLIGTNSAPGGASEVTVTLDRPLTASDHVNITQTVGGMEACVESDGPTPGTGSLIPAVSVAGAYIPPGNTEFAPVLLAGDTKVRIGGVRSDAVAVTVYANGIAIGSNAAPGGASDVDVTVSALVSGATISATQTLPSFSQSSVSLEGEVPAVGTVVGDPTQVPAARVVGIVDAGRTAVRVANVSPYADAVEVFSETTGQTIGTNGSPTDGTSVVTVPALVENHIIKARQTIRVDGPWGATRRVMTPNMLEDFEDLQASDIVGNPPYQAGEYRTWYNTYNYALAVTEATVSTLFDSRCIRWSDNGWTNGIYAIYEQAIPETGTYHLTVEMLVDELGAGDPEFLSSFEAGVIVNGVHRNPTGYIEYISSPKGAYPCLTPGVDGAEAEEAVVVYVETFTANAGDDLLIAFATDVSSYNINATNSGPYSGMWIDNIRLEPGPKPPHCLDVPVVSILATEATPLEAGRTQVRVGNVDPQASLVKVFADGIQIGSFSSPVDSEFNINVDPPLVAGTTLTATQVVDGLEGCQCPGAAGPMVGEGKNSGLLVTLGIRETGSGGGTTGPIEWVGAGSTGAYNQPLGKELPTSPAWQTVTFAWPEAGGSDPVIPALGTEGSNGVIDGTHGVLESLNFTINSNNTGRYVLYIDSIMNGEELIEDFESYGGSTLAVFRNPRFSSSSDLHLLTYPNIAEVDSSKAADGNQSYRVEWQFLDNKPSRWLRLTTAGGEPELPGADPLIDLSKPITVKFLLYGEPPCGLVWADADGDNDVDMDDFAALQRCLTIGATGGGVPDDCLCFDNPFDGVIGADDVASFINCAAGPGVILESCP